MARTEPSGVKIPDLKSSEEALLAPFFESSGMVDLVGRESQIKGKYLTGHMARIDGVVDGEVVGASDASALVIVGRTGRVKGSIRAGQVIVSGIVEGAIIADKIRVSHNGSVLGKMEAPKIVVEKGAFILGDFQMAIPRDNPLHALSS